MDRHEILEWMDAVASCWAKQDYETQRFMSLWWNELYAELRYEVLELCPGMWHRAGGA